MPQANVPSRIVQTTHFDFALAKRIWQPFNKDFGEDFFLLDRVENLTRTSVKVWGGIEIDPDTWGVEVDIWLLNPVAPHDLAHTIAHHIGHFSFIRIMNVEYNEEKEYVQLNFHETEESSTGPHPRALRIFRGGYVAFGGGMWGHK